MNAERTALRLVFHHLGLAVRVPDRATAFLQALGYTIGPRVRDALQNVHLSLCEHPTMPRVEVVWPTETEGPLTSILRVSAELVYHMCYETDDVEGTIRAMGRLVGAVRCVSPPKPAVLFGGRRVSFYLVPGVGLVELLERAAVGGGREGERRGAAVWNAGTR